MAVGPQYLRPSMCCLSEADTARVKKLIVRFGNIERTRLALGIGESTMDAARDCGRMQLSTRERLLVSIARVEGNK